MGFFDDMLLKNSGIPKDERQMALSQALFAMAGPLAESSKPSPYPVSAFEGIGPAFSAFGQSLNQSRDDILKRKAAETQIQRLELEKRKMEEAAAERKRINEAYTRLRNRYAYPAGHGPRPENLPALNSQLNQDWQRKFEALDLLPASKRGEALIELLEDPKLTDANTVEVEGPNGPVAIPWNQYDPSKHTLWKKPGAESYDWATHAKTGKTSLVRKEEIAKNPNLWLRPKGLNADKPTGEWAIDSQGDPNKAVWVTKDQLAANPGRYYEPPSSPLIAAGEKKADQLAAERVDEEIKRMNTRAETAWQQRSTLIPQARAGLNGFRTGAAGDLRANLAGWANLFGFEDIEKAVTGGGGAFQAGLLNSATKRFTLEFAEMLKGQLSNREIGVLEGSVPNLMYSPEGNEILLEVMDRTAERSIREQELFDQFLNEHGTTTLRPKDAKSWNQTLREFREENPIFDKELLDRIPKKYDSVQSKLQDNDVILYVDPTGNRVRELLRERGIEEPKGGLEGAWVIRRDTGGGRFRTFVIRPQ